MIPLAPNVVDLVGSGVATQTVEESGVEGVG